MTAAPNPPGRKAARRSGGSASQESPLPGLTGVAEILAAVAGLTAYVSVLGGAREWVRASAVGLSPDQTLPAVDIRALVSGGVQGLVVACVAIVALLVIVRVADDLARSPRKKTLLHAAGRWWAIATEVMIAYVTLVLALVVVLVVILTVGSVADDALGWRFGVPALWGASLTLVAWLMSRSAKKSDDTTTLPFVVGLPTRVAAKGTRRGLIAVGTTAGVTLVALTAAVQTNGSTKLLDAATLTLTLVTSALMLGVAGTMWARSKRFVEAAGDDSHASLLLVGLALAAAAVTPVWMGVLFLGMVTLLVLIGPAARYEPAEHDDPQRLRRETIPRAALVGALLALVAVAYAAHAPQRYDRITFDGGRADAALLGERGDDYVLGSCDRREHLEGTDTSASVAILRLPRDAAPDAVVVRDDYVFYDRTEPSILSAALGLEQLQPPTLMELRNADISDVCGSTGSAKDVRAAVQRLSSEAAK